MTQEIDRPIVLSEVEATQGVKLGPVRYVLGISLASPRLPASQYGMSSLGNYHFGKPTARKRLMRKITLPLFDRAEPQSGNI